MAGNRPKSVDLKPVFKTLAQARKQLAAIAKALPDMDAYTTIYCIASDLIRDIDSGVKDMAPALKDAQAVAKKDKSGMQNRAKNWCKIE